MKFVGQASQPLMAALKLISLGSLGGFRAWGAGFRVQGFGFGVSLSLNVSGLEST